MTLGPEQARLVQEVLSELVGLALGGVSGGRVCQTVSFGEEREVRSCRPVLTEHDWALTLFCEWRIETAGAVSLSRGDFDEREGSPLRVEAALAEFGGERRVVESVKSLPATFRAKELSVGESSLLELDGELAGT